MSISLLITIIIIISASVENSSAVINRVSHIEHARMPPVVHLDRYDACLLQGNGTGEYCSVQLNLVSEQPSQLYDFITDYSAKRQRHLNHTKIVRGICLTKTCDHFYKRNTTADRREILEACLNESIWNEYKLKTQVTEITCQTLDSKLQLDSYDYVVAACFFLLLALNLLGTLQVLYFGEENEAKGNAFLSCFSIGRNWRKLVAPAGDGPEPRLRRLVGFNGIKAICIIYMMTGHGLFPLAFGSEDSYITEQSYYQSTVYLVYVSCGMLMVQSCLMVSSFLLFYNMEIYAETHNITWRMMPKAILLRWLRFTPAYAFVLIFSATWMRHSGNGPLWKESVMNEVNECRRDWWINLFYINNYVDSVLCFRQAWYIAADFQLFIVGMAVYVLTAGFGRKLVLALLFIFGVMTSAAHTYVHDLDGQQLLSPENVRTLVDTDPTFHYFYKRGHTNMSSYITGLAMGLLVYHCQRAGYQVPKTTRVRYMYWMTFPFGVLIGYFGTKLYEGDTSIYYRTLYAGFAKPLWAINGAFFLFGMINQFEDFYRGIMEWPGWRVPSRLSYSLFLVHFNLIRIITGTRTTTMDATLLHMCEMLASTFMLSMLAALPFHLLVEAPFNQLFKLWMSPSSKQHTDDEKHTFCAKEEHEDDKVGANGDNVEAMTEKDENRNGDTDSRVRLRRIQNAG